MKKLLIILLLLITNVGFVQSQSQHGVIKRNRNTTVTRPKKKSDSQTNTSKKKANNIIRKETYQETLSAESNAIIEGIVSNMVQIQGGSFNMGGTYEQGEKATSAEKPSHVVKLKSYSICKYEVTQKEWIAIMNYNPSTFKGDNLPVDNVSYLECQNFIKKLNKISGRTFRLPTEAEWEYAARGGSVSKGYMFPGGNYLASYAWFSDNSNNTTHPVGTKSPNELGLYDMGGNVWEWCQDWYGTYSSSYDYNPIGPKYGTYKVLRGGSWHNPSTSERVSFRGNGKPSDRCSNWSYQGDYGFRLAM